MNNFYITTPIYYVNDKPHIGHAYTTIACDIISRYNRLLNNDVYFLTGTDEHGQKVEKASKLANLDTQEFVNQMSNTFKNLIPALGCEIDDFIRTTEKRHINAAQKLWETLEKNNQIYLSNYEGWYSIRDEAFYLENELKKVNDSFIAPSGSPVEWVKEESFFFKLSSWEDKLIKYYEKNQDSILPKSRYNEVLSFIKGGLKDLSISRTTFKWGIKVPEEDNHVMYVWIDALCNYLTAINYPDEDNHNFKNFWPGVHVVGKDILRFHAVYWPAFLLAANIEPPKRVYGHGWILSGEEKMSKSKGNILDPIEIINTYGLDPLRYYLIKEVSFGNDGTISKEKLESCINSDLANNYGNLCQRVISFIEKNLDLKVPENYEFNKDDSDVLKIYNESYDKLIEAIDCQNINFYVNFIQEQLFSANKYFNDQEPWKKKNDITRLNTILYVSLELIRKISIMLYPIIPNSSLNALKIFNLSEEEIDFRSIKTHENLLKNVKINKIPILFKKIEK